MIAPVVIRILYTSLELVGHVIHEPVPVLPSGASCESDDCHEEGLEVRVRAQRILETNL